MTERELTIEEILDIERHICEIDQDLDILDPSNSIEAQEIEFKKNQLYSYISLLERKSKLHLRIVS